MLSSPYRAAGLGAVVVGLAAALFVHWGAPDPSADVLRGTEEAFARGLHPRELPPRGAPLRWTGERAWITFRFLPRGPATLEVDVRGHRAPVVVAADGAIVGVAEPGAGAGRFTLADTGRRSRGVELRTSPFQAGDGRQLGTQLRRVTLRTGPRGLPPALLALLCVATALCVFVTAAAASFRPGPAFGVSVTATAALLLAWWPAGVVRSSYAPVAAAIVAAGGVFALAVVRWAARRWPGVGPAAYAGLFLAVLVQGLAATSPVMVVSDAVFHANNLARVAAGDLWLTSFTQHSPPFRFPYGVSFYALLAPLNALGLDPVWLVRDGAALAGVLASAALLALVAPTGDRRAGLAVAALQLLPVTFDLYSYGNLSNVFGQAITVVFFAWWTAGGPGGWVWGAALLAAGALGHFSSFVVLGALGIALLIAWRRELSAERWRVLAVGAGLGAAFLYYAQFAPLAIAQLPRLWQRPAGPPAGAGAGAVATVLPWVGQWGIPMIGLALAAWGRPRKDPLNRALIAYTAAGLALALLALVSPLDVRYIHALGIPFAVAAAAGTVRLWSAGAVGRAAAVGLWLGQALLAARNIVEAVLWRYRP
jgi:hypothetical protein